jgi:uncharacterized SAM-binding protein YcdF (DUF218 family)
MYRLVVVLLEPYTLLWLVTALAVANLWRRRRETRRRLLVLTGAFAAWTLVSIPAVSCLALGTLEWSHPPAEERPADTDAIVVLAGGVTRDRAGRSRPDADTVERCLHAAALYRQGPPCPLLLSGGKAHPADPGAPGAEVMRELLLEMGVPGADMVLETGSRNTSENAAESCRLLAARGARRVVLVTDASHMTRAVRCFEKQGVRPVPSPCNYRATWPDGPALNFLPRAGAAKGCQLAAHEWLGLAWYRLSGRL